MSLLLFLRDLWRALFHPRSVCLCTPGHHELGGHERRCPRHTARPTTH